MDAIEAAARAIDPDAWEVANPHILRKRWAARRDKAKNQAPAAIAAYLEATGVDRDKERLDKMQEIFVKGDEAHIVMCLGTDHEDGCDHPTHPHFEAFDWSWRCEPVRGNTLREVIDKAIATDSLRGGEHG